MRHWQSESGNLSPRRKGCDPGISQACFMKKSKVAVTRTAAELAEALGLTPADGANIALRSDLNAKIIEVVKRKGLTHAQVARLARSSRTRVTAILNRNTKDISTDLLLRVLYALGYTAKVKFEEAA
jgi:predicted XRE-type DNA-binding protein